MQRSTWNDLATFAAIVEAGSFTRAAVSLGVSPSALSHTLRSLEARLGIRLLNRTTRSIAPTAAGERLLARLRPAIADLDQALAQLDADRDRPAGPVRVSAHRTAAIHVILPRLPLLAALHPDITVDLVVQDGFVDIVAERFDAGVRVAEVIEQDMVSVRIGPSYDVVVVAAPAYLSRAGTPVHPADLLSHRCLNYRYTSSGAIHRWPFTRGGEHLTIDTPDGFVSNDVDALLGAAVSGLGVAMLSEPQVTEHVASGRLVRLLEDWCPRVPTNHLYYPGGRQLSAALRAFIEIMRG